MFHRPLRSQRRRHGHHQARTSSSSFHKKERSVDGVFEYSLRLSASGWQLMAQSHCYNATMLHCLTGLLRLVLRNFAPLWGMAVKIGGLLSHRKDAKDRGDTQRSMYIKYCNSSVIVLSKTCCLTKLNHLGHSETLLFPSYYRGLNQLLKA